MRANLFSIVRKFSGSLAFALLLLAIPASAQMSGNSITGVVYGLQRTPIADANVELMDNYYRTLQRTRTDGSGRYFFSGLGSGTFTVRVTPFETDYAEQDQSVELTNFTFNNPVTGEGGGRGFQNETLDFFLKLDKNSPAVTGVLFAQDVPKEAKRLYDQAVMDLNKKRETEAQAGFRAAIEIFPRYYAALERLGSEYLRLKHYQAASILLNAAAEVHPKSHRAWYGLGYSLHKLGHRKEALDASAKAAELYPRSAHYLLLHGILLREEKKAAEAEKQLVKAKEFARGSVPEIHLHLGLIYGTELKRYAEAAKELKQYLKGNENAKDAEKIRAMIKDYEGKSKGASE